MSATISMPDSVYPGNIPVGYPAVLGYCDGQWATESRLRALFPAARYVILTVTGLTLAADGIDCEPGNPDAAEAAAWAAGELTAQPASRPVVYADLESPGYSMTEVLAGLAALGIARDKVRLLTAHYTGKAHICAPATCPVTFTADGTQWTDSFPGAGGAPVDMSLLAANFFGTVPAPTWEEHLMSVIPVIRQGSTDVQAVKNWQGILVAYGYDLGTTGVRKDGVDGSFGALTATATRAFQQAKGLTEDGIAGQATYTAALKV